MIRYCVFVLFVVFGGITAIPLSGYAADGDILVRPQFGIGYADGGRAGSGISTHAGLRILQSANEYKKAGLEATYIDIHQSNGSGIRYLAAGIVLEQKKWNWFNMSIGTIGYFGLSNATANSPGAVANLGWEPDRAGLFKPFITYRVDAIFTSPATQINSLSMGLNW